MAKNLLRVARQRAIAEDFAGVRLGALVGVDAAGRPLVTYRGGPPSPLPARLAVPGPAPADHELRQGVDVVLLFDDRSPGEPIIVGIVRDRFDPVPARSPVLVSDETRSLELNGAAVVVEGRDEIVLRCGLGSLTIRADGQIVVKGTRLVSRASETNKIRGASVQIN